MLGGTERCYARQDAPFFTELFGEFAASQRAGRAAGPYRTPANPYCPAKFNCKADLPQQFKRNYLQIRCTVTGGAYHSARRVSPCVRNGYKTGASLNRTRSTHQTVPQRPFSPPSFPARRKRRGRRRLVENGLDGTSLRCSRSLFSSSFPPNRFAGFAGNLWCRQNKPLVMQCARQGTALVQTAAVCLCSSVLRPVNHPPAALPVRFEGHLRF